MSIGTYQERQFAMLDYHYPKYCATFKRQLWLFMALLASAFAAIAIVQSASVTRAQVSSTQISVEAVPGTLEVPYQGEVQAQVVAHNPTTATLTNVRLSWFTSASVQINGQSWNCSALKEEVEQTVTPTNTVTSADTADTDTVEPNSDHAWTLRIARCGSAPITGTVQLRVDYTPQIANGSPGGQRVSFGTFQLKNRDLESVEALVSIQAQTSLTALNEFRPGMIYLLISNKSNESIYVEKVTPRGPEKPISSNSEPPVPTEGQPTPSTNAQPIKPMSVPGNSDKFIYFAPESAGPATILPHDNLFLPFEVNATNKVRPGKHLLVFETKLGRGSQGNKSTVTLVTTREIEVGVLGESELLGVLALPTFILLPGVLIMITLGVLSNWFGRNATPWGPKEPQFWASVIVLSLFVDLVAYPLITSVPLITSMIGGRRDYLAAYGLIDIAWISVFSILLAAFGYLLWRVIPIAWHWWSYTRTHIPTENDDPMTILGKLIKQEDLDVNHRRIKAKIDGTYQTVFPLQPLGDGPQDIWVGPPMLIKWRRGSDPNLQEEIEPHLKAGGRLDKVLDALEKQKRQDAGAVQVEWKPTGGLTKQRRVRISDRAAAEDGIEKDLIINR